MKQFISGVVLGALLTSVAPLSYLMASKVGDALSAVGAAIAVHQLQQSRQEAARREQQRLRDAVRENRRLEKETGYRHRMTQTPNGTTHEKTNVKTRK